MNKVYLMEITTKDDLIHQGIYFEPPKKSKKAILYIHGLTSAFYHQLHLQQAIIDECEKSDIGYASFNNRGHELLASTYKIDKTSVKGMTHSTIGAGIEDFTQCINDIDAGVTFLKQKGYSSIILIGHSTGANKACYYGGYINDNRVKGIVLASPISDRLMPDMKYLKLKRLALKALITLGFGETLFTNLNFFPITPRRALSLIEPRSDEDVFDYGDIPPTLSVFKKISKPLLVLLGEKDEYADRPVKKIQKIFDACHTTNNYRSEIFAGALHGFDGKEKLFAKTIIVWMNTIV